MSNVVKKVKKQVISLVFFTFYFGLPFKARSSGCKTTQWKSMAIIARNANFFAGFGAKMGKKLIIFNNFILVSLKVTKLIIISFLSFLIKMLFKKFLIWAFQGQNVGAGWVKNDKKGFLHTSHLSANPVLPKNEALNNHSVLIL